MNNFKNLKELYQALLDGKEIINKEGTKASMINDNEIKVAPCDFEEWTDRLCLFDAKSPNDWSIYQESERWFRVTSFYCKNTNPFLHGALYRSKEDFLSQTNSEEKDYKWIKFEEFCV